MTKSWPDAVAAGWVRDQIYGYKATDGAYTTPIVLDPWYGYWMRANVDNLTLQFIYGSGAPALPTPPTTLTTIAPTDLPPLPSPPQASTHQLIFTAHPNPVTNGSTITFEVKGDGTTSVNAVKVEIYDLSGRLVYSSGEVPGISITWHIDNGPRGYLANGVYLYKMYAKTEDQWITSSINKITLVR